MSRGIGSRRPGSRPSRPPRQLLLVLAVVAALLVVTATAGAQIRDRNSFLPSFMLPWWVLALAFAAAEASVLHIQANRETRSVSLSELPLVLGLFLASPWSLLLGRLVGSAAVFVLQRRSSPLKSAFNLALLAAETAVALLLFHAVVPDDAVGPVPVTWLAAYLAILATNVLGAVAVGVVIAVHEGGLHLLGLLREAATAQPAAPMVVTLGLVAVTSLSSAPDNAWLLTALGALLLLAYRGHAALTTRHLNLERVYRFTQAVSNAPEVDELLARILAEAKDLLQSERASVVFLASDDGLVAEVQQGAGNRLARSEEPPGIETAWLLHRVVDAGDSILMPRATRDPAARAWLSRHAARQAVAVPLRGRAGTIGALVVADPLGDVRTYDQDDVLLLETVANHASVALQNGELIGQLRHEAFHDSLTGLPNRANLQRRLDVAMDDVTEGRAPGVAVLILDLDRFKDVNDSLGHHQGDVLLVEVAARLTSAVGSAGTVARLGGDEFAVLLPGAVGTDHALDVGRRLLAALQHPIALDGLEVEVGASVGLAVAPGHAGDPATLLKRADLAMYEAKASTRGLQAYEEELDTPDPHRLTLVSDLRTALHEDQIAVHVQPQARLSDGTTTGVEALVRWRHPTRGWMSPDRFIPAAERSGLIGPLTSRVLDASLAAVGQWRAAGHDLGVAVNLSTRSLHDADLVHEVDRLLRRHAVPADRLTLEITESSVMADPSRAVAVLHQLRDRGVRLSVDDFGTGYSSLSYLQMLPVQEVKIDRSFVIGLAERREDVAIVRAIVDLGRHLELDVVAEGVEDQATWDLLATLGCDLVQGWHLARPMPVGDLRSWLDARTRSAPLLGASV